MDSSPTKGGPPLRISYLWKRDPLDPASIAQPTLTFPVSRKLSKWVTSSSGKSTYEEVFTEEEEAARLAAEAAQKAALRRELERKMKLSAKSAAAEAKAASLGPLQRQAEAAVRLLESAWTDPVSRRPPSLSPGGLLPRASRALHAELDRRGYSSELERLPSPQREDKRQAASAAGEKEKAGREESVSESESESERASSVTTASLLFRPDASIRRHQRTTRPRHTLDVRPLKLGTYNTGETSEVSERDLAVLAVIKESRKSQKKALDGCFLVQAERDLFDSQYSRHICEVLDIQRRSRYKTEAEKQAAREARRPKTEEWRAKK